MSIASILDAQVVQGRFGEIAGRRESRAGVERVVDAGEGTVIQELCDDFGDELDLRGVVPDVVAKIQREDCRVFVVVGDGERLFDDEELAVGNVARRKDSATPASSCGCIDAARLPTSARHLTSRTVVKREDQWYSPDSVCLSFALTRARPPSPGRWAARTGGAQRNRRGKICGGACPPRPGLDGEGPSLSTSGSRRCPPRGARAPGRHRRRRHGKTQS